MLYKFSALEDRLTELGYPEATEKGFKIIRRDLTKEERAGNLEYQPDGIYLAVDGQSYKGYMYMKFADIALYGYPKFHIRNCKTIADQKARGQFDGKYFWHNSNTVTIKDRTSGEIHEKVTLELCGNCRKEGHIGDYDTTEGFFSLLDQQEMAELNKEYEVDIFGYTLDWQKISRAYKKAKGYTCERCAVRIDVPAEKRYIHVHHLSGDKVDNRLANLQCLCVLCHSHVDDTHLKNFQTRRLQREIKTFISKYRSALEACGNPFLHQ